MNERSRASFASLLLLSAGALICTLLVAAAPAAAYTIPPPPAPAVTTGAPTGVTAAAAMLNGVIDTHGVGVSWHFEFGPSTSYGAVTPTQHIAAGKGKVPVSWELVGLNPLTFYDFRLVASADGLAGQTDGQNQGFLTAPTGFVFLRGARLKISHRVASVPLSCASQRRCTGHFKITTKRRGKTVVCDSSPFSLKPNRHLKFKVKIRAACRSLIRHARRHRINAKFTLLPSSSQFGIVDKITLTL